MPEVADRSWPLPAKGVILSGVGTQHQHEENTVIHTRSLTKDFVVSKTNTVHAVRGISLDIEPGELVAVLGPNGAGKSTTMRMLTTLIAPTAGSATVAGHDVVAESAQRPEADRVRRAGQRRRAQPARRRRAVQPGPDLRAGPAVRTASGRRTARGTRSGRARLAQGVEPVRRAAAAAGRGDGPGAFAVAAVPRRAVDRARPAEPGEPVGAHSADAGERQHADDDHADHPLPGRGRLDGRAGWWSSTTAR